MTVHSFATTQELLHCLVTCGLFLKYSFHMVVRGCHGRDCMVVGFTTTCAISAYHH
jgi:hypothetical protein